MRQADEEPLQARRGEKPDSHRRQSRVGQLPPVGQDGVFAQESSVHYFSDQEQVVVPLGESKGSVTGRKKGGLESVTSASPAFRTAVTVSGAKSRWRGAEEQQSSPHSPTSRSSRALTGASDPRPGPATTPSPWSDEGASGSSPDTEQTPEALSARAGHRQRQRLRLLLPSLQASRTVELTSICSDTAVENWAKTQREDGAENSGDSGWSAGWSPVPSCRPAPPPASAAAPPPDTLPEAPRRSSARPQRSAGPKKEGRASPLPPASGRSYSMATKMRTFVSMKTSEGRGASWVQSGGQDAPLSLPGFLLGVVDRSSLARSPAASPRPPTSFITRSYLLLHSRLMRAEEADTQVRGEVADRSGRRGGATHL